MNVLSSILLVLLFSVTCVHGSSSVADLEAIAIADSAERAAVSAATDSLEATGSAGDLQALEILVRQFKKGVHGAADKSDVIETIGRGVSYGFGDPLKQRAYEAIRTRAYSVDFLEKAIKEGSARVAVWGLKVLASQDANSGYPDPLDGSEDRGDMKHWEEENRSPWVQRLVAAHGVVSTDFLIRITPLVKKLRESKDDELRKAASEFLEFHKGLICNRDEILATLASHRSDEKALEKDISELNDRHVNPGITPEIWDILLHTKDQQLISTAMCYDWLFCLPAFSKDKLRFIENQLATGNGGVWTNLNSALTRLALSVNPLAPEIVKSLSESTIPSVRKDAAVYADPLIQ